MCLYYFFHSILSENFNTKIINFIYTFGRFWYNPPNMFPRQGISPTVNFFDSASTWKLFHRQPFPRIYFTDSAFPRLRRGGLVLVHLTRIILSGYSMCAFHLQNKIINFQYSSIFYNFSSEPETTGNELLLLQIPRSSCTNPTIRFSQIKHRKERKIDLVLPFCSSVQWTR